MDPTNALCEVRRGGHLAERPAAGKRNNRVCAITRSGLLETVAGFEAGGDTPGPVAATAARLNEPRGLWLHRDVLLICDHYNNRIKALRLAGCRR